MKHAGVLDPNVHVVHLSFSKKDREAVSRAASNGLAVHTPVSIVFGLIGIMGVLLNP